MQGKTLLVIPRVPGGWVGVSAMGLEKKDRSQNFKLVP